MENNALPDKTANLLVNLHGYKSARIVITIKAGIPVTMKVFYPFELNEYIDIQSFTVNEIDLINTLKTIWYGQVEVEVEEGQVKSILEGTYKTVEL